ncbi:MAG: lipopolysaccharide biosynthesis protein [Microthrixaceae bacterium]|nr:lipopolysaccharide biosynthesis protein [Microthrixaceae bacterium]
MNDESLDDNHLDDNHLDDNAEVKDISLRRDWMFTTGTSLVIGLVVFVTAPIAANRLGPAGRGTLVTVQLLPQILAQLASLGLGFATIHFGARERRSVRVFWRWSLSRCAIGSLAVFALGQLLAPVLTSNAGDQRMLRVYLLLCPLQAFVEIPYEILRALGLYRSWNGFTFLIQMIWPIALLIGVLQPTPSLWMVVWLHLALMLMVLVVITFMVLRATSGRSRPPKAELSEFTSYGLKSALSTIPSSANAKLDQLVMAAFVSKPDLGLYAAAAGWSQLTLPVMRGLMAVSMPFVSGAADDERPARAIRLITLGLGSVLILGVGGILATLVLWGPLYGPEYKSALPAALVLMVASLLLQYNGVLSNILRSLNRPGVVTAIETGVLVLSTVALVIALSISPVLGAAVVSFLTYSVAASIYAKEISRNVNLPARRLIDIGGAMSIMREVRAKFTR